MYPVMCLCVYLKVRARVDGLGWRRLRRRVDTVMEQCGLTDVSHRIVGQLSKGYKQRVGLADALVHEPELIILDEPTIGLDPNQIRAVRQLIKNLGEKHTVLISTHILPEAEMTCNRMVIMYEGKILASGTPEDLQRLSSEKSQVIAEIAAPQEDLASFWSQMAEVERFDITASEGEYFRCALTAFNGVDLRPRIYTQACRRGWPLRELTRSRHSLEDIYVQVTRPEEEEEL